VTEQAAQLIVTGIAGLAALAWVAGVLFLKASARAGRVTPDERFGFDQPEGTSRVAGSVEVEGQPWQLAQKAAAVLAKGASPMLGPVKILSKTDERIELEGAAAVGAGIGRWLGRATITFQSRSPDRTCIDYSAEISGGRGLLWTGAVFAVLGAVAIAVGYWLLSTLAAPDPRPEVRGQVFQMFQAVHFLWPPFLFGGVYRFRFRAARTGFETVLQNLPYRDE
jgi:hypothetical protein